MHWTKPHARIATGFLAALAVAAAPTAQHPTRTDAAVDADDEFYRAYFYEHEEGNYARAAELYERLLAKRGTPAELRREIEARLAACREELACADFAALLPPNPLAYFELNRPGDQLEALLEEVGLLQIARDAAGGRGRELGVSPALVRGLVGMRGAAIALTGVNPASGEPTGVGIFHPGDLDVVRGLIETALPTGAQPTDDLGGFPTYEVEDKAFVTLTSRLVIASSSKREIRNVIDRLQGGESESLASNAMLMEAMGDRGDALLTFCLNPGPVMPLLKLAAMQEPQAAGWMELCDPDSLETIVGRVGVAGGLSLDVALNLAEGHESLAFHFLRLPPIQRDTLASVPAGAAGFVAASLNEARRYDSHARSEPYVSFMDFGREIFGNIASVAVYALPPSGATNGGGGDYALPRAGAVISVNDPDKTERLWGMVLGVASLSAGGALHGESFEVGSVHAHRYTLPEGLSLYGAVAGDELFLASTRDTLEAALATRQGGASVLDDRELAPALAQVDPNSSMAFVVHAARCLQVGLSFADGHEAEEMAAILPMLDDSVAALVLSHGPSSFRLSAAMHGLPDVGELVAAHLRGEGAHGVWGEGGGRRVATRDESAGHAREASHSLEDLRAEFDELAARGKREAAVAHFRSYYERVEGDPLWLNNFAWALLTEERYERAYDELALELSRRSNELTDHGNWAYLDTLALAVFRAGDVERAIELERRALELVDDDGARAQLEDMLADFEAARAERVAGDA